MTAYGWDASNHDWPRGPMNLTLARQQGISLFTHKAGEGDHFYTDTYFGEAMNRAKAANFPVIGGYFVNHGGDQNVQADWFLAMVEQCAPWWRSHPCFIFQLDAEKFDYMPRPPSIAECNAFCDRLRAKTGLPRERFPIYAPKWLYGDQLGGLQYPWWQSDYGKDNPPAPFKIAAPAPTDSRWAAVGGKTPTVLQYGSQLTIAGQSPADANAIRVNSDQELVALFSGNTKAQPSEDDEMKPYIVTYQGMGWIVAADLSSRTALKSAADQTALLATDQYLNPKITPETMGQIPEARTLVPQPPAAAQPVQVTVDATVVAKAVRQGLTGATATITPGPVA